MFQRGVSFVISMVSLCIVTGCAGRHNYGRVTPSIPAVGVARVVVATQDHRPYIISGEKRENFVGLQRSGYGIPFYVTTRDATFAESFSNAACNALRSAGSTCSTVRTFLGQSDSSVKQKVSQQGSSGIVFTIKEWKSDSMVRASMKYDVEVAVLNSAGKVLASHTIHGSKLTNDSIWVLSPARAARLGSEKALKDKLEELLSSPMVVAALRGNGSKQSMERKHSAAKNSVSYSRYDRAREAIDRQKRSSDRCSTEQVLKMKEIGLSDSQIKSSCK